MSLHRILGATVVGVFLAALPFLHFAGPAVGRVAPHGNHEARHGGELAMVGEHHIELVRNGRLLELFVSDAWRQPLRPRDASIAFEDTEPRALTWDGHRMIGPDQPSRRTAQLAINLNDGTRLDVTFDRP